MGVFVFGVMRLLRRRIFFYNVHIKAERRRRRRVIRAAQGEEWPRSRDKSIC